ncbi:MAG: hypothetical protein MK193_10350 [Lentisphaeria bacterium]|nr:hypothetical protein [Lentisphaeria bacterium]
MIPSKKTEKFIILTAIIFLLQFILTIAMQSSYTALPLRVFAFFAISGFLISGISLFYSIVIRQEFEEKEEIEQLRSQDDKLFKNDEQEIAAREKSRISFEKVLLPVLTSVVILFELWCGFYIWQSLPSWIEQAPTGSPLILISVFLIAAVVFYLLGSFLSGIAYGNRVYVLRGVASELVGIAVLMGITGVLLLIRLREGWVDFIPIYTNLLAIIFILRAIEKILSLIAEGYRPKNQIREKQLVFESRMFTLFAQPESVINSLSETFQYQFGIELTSQVAKKIGYFIVFAVFIQTLILFIFSCFVIIRPGEEAIVEVMGQPGEGILQPGLHVKAPWPFAAVYRVSTNQAQSLSLIDLNADLDERIGPQKEYLWDSPKMSKLPTFLVPLPHQTEKNEKESASFSILAANATITYQIDNLYNYLYATDQPQEWLRATLARGLMRELAAHPLEKNLLDNGQILEQRLSQSLRKDLNPIGIELLDVHVPFIQAPKDVVASFHANIQAQEQSEKQVLDAEGQSLQAKTNAKKQQSSTIADAEIYATERSTNAEAQAIAQQKLMSMYRQYSDLYKERALLERLEILVNVDKLVLATDLEHQVIRLDLKKDNTQLFDFMEDSNSEK